MNAHEKTMEIRPLRADEIECRVQSVKANGFSLLLYKDARCDMRILDETFGIEKWQRTHEVINGNLFCNVGIKFENEWVWKQDVGTESNTEKEKGQASDSFKRACFNWGIGRELYTSPFIWITGEDSKEKYYVKEIGYNDKKEINKLVIENQKGKEVYKMGVRKIQTNATPETEKTKTISEAQAKRLFAIAKTNGFTADQVKAAVKKDYDRKPEEMDTAMYNRLIDRLESAKK